MRKIVSIRVSVFETVMSQILDATQSDSCELSEGVYLGGLTGSSADSLEVLGSSRCRWFLSWRPPRHASPQSFGTAHGGVQRPRAPLEQAKHTSAAVTDAVERSVL